MAQHYVRRGVYWQSDYVQHTVDLGDGEETTVSSEVGSDPEVTIRHDLPTWSEPSSESVTYPVACLDALIRLLQEHRQDLIEEGLYTPSDEPLAEEPKP